MADTILSLLEPGEYVLNQNAVDKIGKDVLDEINYKEAPRFPNKSIMGDYFNQQSIPQFSNGGPVSYGGYESEQPTLEGLYEMFSVKPKGEYASRFQDYDTSREGVYREDYSTALENLAREGEGALGKLYEQTGGLGGFSNFGFGEKTRKGTRKDIMSDYLSGQKSAYSTMFKGVRDEREGWLREIGGQLGALQEAEGTDTYKKTYTPPGDDSDVPSDDPSWSPPDIYGVGSIGTPYMFNGQNYYWSGYGWMTQQQFDDSGLSSASGDT